MSQETVEFKIVSYKDHGNLKISHSQIRLIINALEIFKDQVEKGNEHEFLKENRCEGAQDLITYFSQIINYNYEEAVNQCINKRAKRKSKDDVGIEVMDWLAN